MHKRELVIIGAGPAGMAAARVAGTLGIDTLVLDEQPSPGGQIFRGIKKANSKLLEVLGPEYVRGYNLITDMDHPSVCCLLYTSPSPRDRG